MALHDFLASLGFEEFLTKDIFTAQVGVLAATAFFFAGSLVLCLMAFRAARAAGRSRSEAQAHFRSAQDLAVEVRRLTAQVEKATTRRAAASVPSTPMRVSAAETTEEAEVVIEAAEEAPEPVEGAENAAVLSEEKAAALSEEPAAEPVVTDHTLEEATKAATVPSALLRNSRRRRFS